jgi:sigma-B regulation protein RsbU (phosphoserine phosphatase)
MEENKWMGRIKELEEELRLKETELSMYRHELVKANQSLEKIIHQLHGELRAAQQIQRLLSPTEIPSISGFEFSHKFAPGSTAGGDYFDIFEHDDKMKFGVLLASSSGYSMSALLLSIVIKISGSMQARKGLLPHEVVQLIMKEAQPQMQEKDSSGLFYAVIDRRSFEMSYCFVGPIWAGALEYESRQFQAFDHHGNKFQKNSSAPTQSSSIHLNPRDRVILCTEGLVQARNPQSEIYGEMNLLQSIINAPRSGVHELRNEIFYQVEKFSQSDEPIRDQTAIVMEVKDRVIKLAKKEGFGQDKPRL